MTHSDRIAGPAEGVANASFAHADAVVPAAVEAHVVDAGSAARDVELGWSLARNPSQLKIQTIDSFAYELVSQSIGDGNATGIELIEDAERVIASIAAPRLEEEVVEEEDELLEADVEQPELVSESGDEAADEEEAD